MAPTTNDYKNWLSELKNRIYAAQIKAALSVNAELLSLYWHLGFEILDKEKDKRYGSNLIGKLSQDLMREFPFVKGFSRSNIYTIRQWVLFHTQKGSIVQPPVGQLTGSGQPVDSQLTDRSGKLVPPVLLQIPWGHHCQIIAKCKSHNEALFYITEAAKHNWSRNVLLNQLDSNLWHRKGKAITNFEQTLPAPQSDLARELIKDPYAFDFLGLTDDHKERDLEKALMDNLTRFLLELGLGFSFVGRQYPLKVGDKEFAIDLLFYHFKLRCFIVIELKAGEFIPEYTGKLNFYQNVVDDVLRQQEDNPTIGILICKKRNEIVTEYALRGINKPIGVSQYVSDDGLSYLYGCLPTEEQIQESLSEVE